MYSSSSDSLSPPRLPCVFIKDVLLAAPGSLRFPGISAKLVRICEITGNFHRCKIFLNYFANFCKRAVWYGGNAPRTGLRVSAPEVGSAGRSPLAVGADCGRYAAVCLGAVL